MPIGGELCGLWLLPIAVTVSGPDRAKLTLGKFHAKLQG